MAISITEHAAEKIRGLVGVNCDKGLRLKIVGGGCSGLSYKMDIDSPKEGDRVYEQDGAKVIVDRKSFLYVNGTELHYSDSLMDAGFKLKNPNVKRTCGCGASFSV